MRIQSFSVSGYANFLRPVAITALDDINVVYGPNNAGKTNLLKAIELYFRLLGLGEQVSSAQALTIDDPDPALAALLRTAFHRTEPQPIVFLVEWQLGAHELEEAGLHHDVQVTRITTQLEVRRLNRTLELRVQKWVLNTEDAANMDTARNPKATQFASQTRRYLSDCRPFQFDKPVLPSATIGASRDLFPQALRDRIFDARQSVNPSERKRWALWLRLASTLEVELGSGTWDTAFDRATGRADLVYTRGEDTIPVDSMGAGIQRIASMLAELAMSGERWICVDEPEWKLHPELQKRFITLARRAIETGVGPIQLFITTHSQTLANLCSPFLLQVEDDVVRADRRPWSSGRGVESFGDPADMIGGHETNLASLIGLVETLSEIDPDELLGGFSNGFDGASGPALAFAGAERM